MVAEHISSVSRRPSIYAVEDNSHESLLPAQNNGLSKDEVSRSLEVKESDLQNSSKRTRVEPRDAFEAEQRVESRMCLQKTHKQCSNTASSSNFDDHEPYFPNCGNSNEDAGVKTMGVCNSVRLDSDTFLGVSHGRKSTLDRSNVWSKPVEARYSDKICLAKDAHASVENMKLREQTSHGVFDGKNVSLHNSGANKLKRDRNYPRLDSMNTTQQVRRKLQVGHCVLPDLHPMEKQVDVALERQRPIPLDNANCESLLPTAIQQQVPSSARDQPSQRQTWGACGHEIQEIAPEDSVRLNVGQGQTSSGTLCSTPKNDLGHTNKLDVVTQSQHHHLESGMSGEGREIPLKEKNKTQHLQRNGITLAEVLECQESRLLATNSVPMQANALLHHEATEPELFQLHNSLDDRMEPTKPLIYPPDRPSEATAEASADCGDAVLLPSASMVGGGGLLYSTEIERVLASRPEVELLTKLKAFLDVRIKRPTLATNALSNVHSENVLELLHARATNQQVQWVSKDLSKKKACTIPGDVPLQLTGGEFEISKGNSRPRNPSILKTALMGWRGPKRRLTTACTLLRERFSTVVPLSFSYTHSSARGTEREQKLLDVRFRPESGGGPPKQLIVSANKSPSELVMYNLEEGTKKDLSMREGCAIQDILYARGGELIVSAGATNGSIHVWDSETAELLHQLGPGCAVTGTPGHNKEVGQLALIEDNCFSGSSLLATHGSGADDRQILLWDLNGGRFVRSINGGIASRRLNSMGTFNSDILVGLGEQSRKSNARAEVWDPISCALKFFVLMPGSSVDIVHSNPLEGSSLFLAGCETGITHVFDVRTNGPRCVFSTEPGKRAETTSASFSSCGLYMQTSSSDNVTRVYDLRMARKPLHRLDHGIPAKTVDPLVDPRMVSVTANAVDKGDEGVNSAEWLHRSPLLLTGCGNGTVALWDISLGVPCIWYKGPENGGLHRRSINGVAVSYDDSMFASCSDEQKVVLYGPKHTRGALRLTNLIDHEGV